MSEENGGSEIARTPRPEQLPVPGRVVRRLQLGQQTDLDLTNLAPHQADAIEGLALEKAVDRDDRRQRLRDDLSATAAQLGQFTNTVESAAANNASVTITNTKDDSYGRTEIIIGNSTAASAGKLSRSQQGLGDNNWLWVILAVIAGIVVVLVTALKR
jgi:hypothetical protein